MELIKENSPNEALLLGTTDVASLLQCSERHVTNLRREGRIPAPVKLGVLVRWPRKSIEDWIQAGCPDAAEPSTVGERKRA